MAGSVVLICAMGLEAAALPKERAGVSVVESGVGFRAAAETAERVVAGRPELVLSVGTCGALDPKLEIGQVRVVRRVEGFDGGFDALDMGGAGGVLWSQDRVAVTVREKQELHARGAEIVDMEAVVVARVCAGAGVPFGCVKAVSDLASEDLPLDFNLYRDEAGRFQTSRIAFAGMMKIGELMRLQRQSKLAAQQLGAWIEEFLGNRS